MSDDQLLTILKQVQLSYLIDGTLPISGVTSIYKDAGDIHDDGNDRCVDDSLDDSHRTCNSIHFNGDNEEVTSVAVDKTTTTTLSSVVDGHHRINGRTYRLDSVQPWIDILSGGEKQRLSLARYSGDLDYRSIIKLFKCIISTLDQSNLVNHYYFISISHR